MKRLAIVSLTLGLCGLPAFAQDADDPCAGKNPKYCQAEAEEAPAAAPPASASDADEASDECEGRNPLYCGVTANDPAESAGSGDDVEVVVMPPGGCEGRNPLYCQEEAPAPTVQPAPELRKERASQTSSNPNRNPNPNPNANPNRRSKGSGSGGSGGS